MVKPVGRSDLPRMPWKRNISSKKKMNYGTCSKKITASSNRQPMSGSPCTRFLLFYDFCFIFSFRRMPYSFLFSQKEQNNARICRHRFCNDWRCQGHFLGVHGGTAPKVFDYKKIASLLWSRSSLEKKNRSTELINPRNLLQRFVLIMSIRILASSVAFVTTASLLLNFIIKQFDADLTAREGPWRDTILKLQV